MQKKYSRSPFTSGRVGDELVLTQCVASNDTSCSIISWLIIKTVDLGRRCLFINRYSVRDSKYHAISMKTLAMKLWQLDFHFNRLIIITHRIHTIDQRSIGLNIKTRSTRHYMNDPLTLWMPEYSSPLIWITHENYCLPKTVNQNWLWQQSQVSREVFRSDSNQRR